MRNSSLDWQCADMVLAHTITTTLLLFAQDQRASEKYRWLRIRW